MSHKWFLIGSGFTALMMAGTPAYLVFKGDVFGAVLIGAASTLILVIVIGTARSLATE